MRQILIKKLLCVLPFLCFVLCLGCKKNHNGVERDNMKVTAEDILGNSNYKAISYGGYRHKSRDVQPTIEELKEDVRLLAAMDIKLLRTYNTKLAQATNLLQAIEELKQEDANFEMYVMLGAWINCKNAFSDREPDHDAEDAADNQAEIDRAIALAQKHPDIVKIIAVGNEAMVKWAASYYVQPWVILKYVNQLQELKQKGDLPANLWITSSDNFASWGGGEDEYHVEDLEKLINAVDYISMHTYPMHDTHYNPEFWFREESNEDISLEKDVDNMINRSLAYAKSQYESVVDYVNQIDKGKTVHIGETGWASFSNGFYGDEGSRACDEYKSGEYYKKMRNWTNNAGISCFYFEAFDEPWKDAGNDGGSENHFGLFTVDGEAKYAIWDKVDQGVFDGLSRGGNEITKSFDGDQKRLLDYVRLPEAKEMVQ